MTVDIVAVEYEHVNIFDRVEVNVDHRVEYDGDTLRSAWPDSDDPTEYVVAEFSVDEDGHTTVPSGSQVVDVGSDEVVVLVPTEVYDE